MSRWLRKIIATTDVHSAFDVATPMLTHLHTARAESLIVDCGDFFEGSGYHRFGKGRIEREILTSLYDLLAPGNHGWPHYFEPGLHEMTLCANASDANGKPLFDRVCVKRIGSQRVAITTVIGPQAFHTIPTRDRNGHHVTDPAHALREVMLENHHRADAWIVLSHSGFEKDLELAAACPRVDVIFAGHCHSDTYGPVRIGDTLIVKGCELGIGYATATSVGSGWTARTCTFPNAAAVPEDLATVQEKISFIGRKLASPLGTVNEPYRNGELDRSRLLREIAGRLRSGLGADAVILNETALRSVPLGEVLTLGDLLAVEPFDNHLVHAALPDERAQLFGQLAEHVGPLAIAPMPLPLAVSSVLTTDYLADNHLGGRTRQAGLRLGQAVQRVVTAAGGEQ
ncbi:metallophosphoesterase [Streptomyces acidiscabies]|uniref:Metallophosphoesterase n=1 Tax=Streptomyces acidiscabies TaxID=42234 RepID=A0AAP6EJL4_9ACTN|nr:metallophosphoesterase [Streptomyces acidiscabies]MBP5938600.1 bifunctional metallophosphatase/5'-nucleotidase [Streptomyces sp. LBUM 1476]MBZ3909696.1 bifunctional metallophosphatase/5'-nucleotidase [Streptomyces acidiscabies]MDX2965342.1 metallophosphoesterase [Streptomyces acidiscabies]MDX3024589.1 metallophosphoesterase [Streptomyces acidiscabies]MDX3795176.1 metallophosphoesterase [Streptomyces acidiscabies]